MTKEFQHVLAQKLCSIAYHANARASSSASIQASGFEDEDGAVAGMEPSGRSMMISGCHEATETRTILVKNTFLNAMSLQLHRAWLSTLSLWIDYVRREISGRNPRSASSPR